MGDRVPARQRADRRAAPCTSTRRAAAGRCARCGRRATPRSSPTWTSTCRPTSTRSCPSSRRCCPGHSDVAIGTRLASRRARRAGPEARGHLARYNLLLAGDAAQRLLRRAVRLQGRAQPTSPARCCRWSRTRAGSSTPSCSCSPSTTACASTRCRSTGSTTRTRASTSSRTAAADLRGRVAHAAALRAWRRRARRRATRRPRRPSIRHGSAASSSASRRSASSAPSCSPCCSSLLVGPLGVVRRRRRRARACARSPTPRPTGGSRSRCAGRAGRARHYAAGTALGLLPLVAHAARRWPCSRRSATTSLAAAAGRAHRRQRCWPTVVRFVLLRRWVFRAVSPASRQWLRYGDGLDRRDRRPSLTVLGVLVTATRRCPPGGPTSSRPRSAPSRRSSSTGAGCGAGPARARSRGEVGPFCAMSFVGLALSTLAVSLAAACAAQLGLLRRACARSSSRPRTSPRADRSGSRSSSMLDRVLFRSADRPASAPSSTPSRPVPAPRSPTRSPHDQHRRRTRRRPLPRRAAGADARRGPSRRRRAARPARPGPRVRGAAGPTTRRGSGPRCSLLLVGTAVLYLWGLGASGWANTFYSAAVQAGTKSWKAFFFGSSDASNFITVDKPPAVAVGDGALGAALRRQLVEHPRAAGARGRRRRRRALRRGAPLVLARGRR